MQHALDEHLGQGFDIESATDNWVLLRHGDERLALTCAPADA
jgi:hypothetical protein